MNITIQNNLRPVMRLFIALATLVLSSFSLKAQDLIVTQSGETIKAYRTDIGEKMVYYQLEDTEEASVMKIQKVDVLVIKLQNGEVIYPQQEKPSQLENEEQTVAIIPPTEPVADPKVIASAQVGSLIEFYDGSKGVVFYLDGNGHGLAVYLYENKSLMCWQKASSWVDCIDVEAIPNMRKTEMQMGLGSVYCNAAIKQLGLEELPVIKWCRSIGPDWYLPSLGELYELMVVANHSKGREGPISQSIKAKGGDAFASTRTVYLSSSEADNTDVYSVFPTDGVRIAKKYNSNGCRAIRMF